VGTRRLRSETLRIVTGGHQQRGSGIDADTGQCQQARCGLGHQVPEQLVDAFRLFVEGQDPSPEGLDRELGGIQHRLAGGAWTQRRGFVSQLDR
jgi:hypothetical protein